MRLKLVGFLVKPDEGEPPVFELPDDAIVVDAKWIDPFAGITYLVPTEEPATPKWTS